MMNRTVICAATALLVSSAALAQGLPAGPRAHVEDLAAVIDAGTEQRLNNLLAELKQKAQVEVVVLTVRTTGDRPADMFTVETAQKWGLGKKGSDKGCLVMVAVDDRKYFIATGYGLEATLTDRFVGSIGRRYFQPNFRRGNYSAGILAGVSALADRVAKADNIQLSGAAARSARSAARHGENGKGAAAICGFMPIVLIIIFSVVFSGRRRGYGGWSSGAPSWWMWLLLLNAGSHGRHRGGWGGGLGGGGFGGGGFGGGGFGGGGSFGGGGAGGGW